MQKLPSEKVVDKRQRKTLIFIRFFVLCFYPNKNVKQAKLGKEFGYKPGLPDGIHTYLHANNPNLGCIFEGLVMESFCMHFGHFQGSMF
jgi:hypothetical protein